MPFPFAALASLRLREKLFSLSFVAFALVPFSCRPSQSFGVLRFRREMVYFQPGKGA